mgnify:CR=1 FL=1
MDGMLTQDEINALLNGMDLSDSSNNASKDEPAGSSDDAPAATAGAAPASNEDALTDIERQLAKLPISAWGPLQQRYTHWSIVRSILQHR